jgi:hypothetical protein
MGFSGKETAFVVKRGFTRVTQPLFTGSKRVFKLGVTLSQYSCTFLISLISHPDSCQYFFAITIVTPIITGNTHIKNCQGQRH